MLPLIREVGCPIQGRISGTVTVRGGIKFDGQVTVFINYEAKAATF